MRKYFEIGSKEWKITVKWCILIGLFVGLVGGSVILINFFM